MLSPIVADPTGQGRTEEPETSDLRTKARDSRQVGGPDRSMGVTLR
jgi:hypothetical protein